MRLYTQKLTELTIVDSQDAVGAPKKVFTRGSTWKCGDARDGDFFKATAFGPEEASAALIVMGHDISSEWVEYPAQSGEVYRITNRRVVQAGRRVVFYTITPLVGEAQIT